jgi:hypothetical protein
MWTKRNLGVFAVAGILLCAGSVLFSARLLTSRPGSRDEPRIPFKFPRSNKGIEEHSPGDRDPGGLAGFTSNIPIIVFKTVWPGPVSTSKSYSLFEMTVYEPKAGEPARIGGNPTLATRAGLHVRGMLSRSFPKLSYRMKLQDGAGQKKGKELLGMPADADWVLHGPWLDKSLIRNAFSYDLARAMGCAAMRARPCELFLSTSGTPVTEADYMGVYYLIEDIERGKERVNLQKLVPEQNSEPEITGGYLLAWDVGEGRYLPSWKSIQLKYPKQPSRAQKLWIDQAITRFDHALKGPDYRDPVKGYAAHIDVDAWVNYILFEELIFNLDGYSRSFYMHKDRGGKLRPGPVWDHDLAMGHQFQNGTSFDIWWYTLSGAHKWIQRLASDSAFRERMSQRWAALRKDLLSDSAIERRINRIAEPLLLGPAERNFQRWDGLNLARPLPRPIDYITIKTQTYPEQITAIKRFLRERAAWMDRNLGP